MKPKLEALTPDGEQKPGFTPGPYETETVEVWREIIVYAPWSEKVTADTATFADYRGALIAKLHYTEHGVPTHEQAEANARLLKAAPALYEVITVLLDVMEMQEGREREEFHILQREAWHVWTNAKIHARAALALVDGPQSNLPAEHDKHNELRELASILITNAEMIPDPRREGATDCYAVTLDDLEALE